MPNNQFTIAIPSHRNSFFIASILGLLLPVLDKGPMIRTLFGENIAIDDLEYELEHCYLNLFPHLNQFVNLYLRPRLAAYIKENPTHFKGDPQSLLQRATSISEGTLACGPIEIQAFSLLTNTHIQVATSAVQPDEICEYGSRGAQNTIKIYYTNESNALCTTSIGYKRHLIPGDGDCCFTAFGIHRETAYSLLDCNLKKIVSYIQPLLDAALLTEKYYDHLKRNQSIPQDISFEVFSTHYQQYRKNTGILRVYLKYDLLERAVENGWGHPAFLQALAHLLRINLRIWEKDSAEQLQPLSTYADKYARYSSGDNNPWIDLLWVNRSHFDRLELIGYDETSQNRLLTPLTQQLNSSCHVRIDSSDDLSGELGKQLKLFSVVSVVKEEADNQPMLTVINQSLGKISSYLDNMSHCVTIPGRNSYRQGDCNTVVSEGKTIPALLQHNRYVELFHRVDFQAANRDLMHTVNEALKANDTRRDYFVSTGLYGGLEGATVSFLLFMAERWLAVSILPPVFAADIAFTGIGVGYGLAGKHFAERLKSGLRKAHQQIDEGLSKETYEERKDFLTGAAEPLVQEYNDWFANICRYFQTSDSARSFLSFCLGVCSNVTGNYSDAYEKYGEAIEYAKKAQDPFGHLQTTLLKIQLLKEKPAAEVYVNLTPENSKRRAQAEINDLLKALTPSFEPAFTDCFWSIFDRIREVSKIDLDNMSSGEMELVHYFIQLDNFFLLKHYAHEKGQYIEVLGRFAQVLLLATASLKSLKIFSERVKAYEIPITDVVNKCVQCVETIHQFKNNNPSTINNNKDLKNNLLSMEKFILDIYTYFCFGKTLEESRYYALARNLFDSSLSLPSRLRFLSTLKEEFSVHHPSIESWLDSITHHSPTSEITGNNMLHMLVKLKAGDVTTSDSIDSIHAAAKKLASFYDKQNKKQEAPYGALTQSDPFAIKAILDEYQQEIALANAKKQATLPESSFLNDIKIAIIGHIGIYLSSKPSEKRDLYHKNVISSLDIVFADVRFCQQIADAYRKIPSSQIPNLREKTEYLVKLVSYDAVLIRGICGLVKESAIANAHSLFSTKVADYIQNVLSQYIVEENASNATEETELLTGLQIRMEEYFRQYKPTVTSRTYAFIDQSKCLNNVLDSLKNGIFNSADRRAQILGFYSHIDESRIPRNEYKNKKMYLIDLLHLAPITIEKLYKLAMDMPQKAESQFAADVIRCIRDAWQPNCTGNVSSNRNTFFLSENTSDQERQETRKKINQKMNIFRSAFMHFISKTYTLFAFVLSDEAVNYTKNDALSKTSDALKSMQVCANVNVPFVGGIEVSITHIMAGVLDLVGYIKGHLEKQKMKHFYEVFSSDETQRFNEMLEAALKLSVELSPELYHMTEISIVKLAEIISIRVINKMTNDPGSRYLRCPSMIEQIKTTVLDTKPDTPTERKPFKQICQEGMRSHRGSKERSEISQLAGEKDGPTYEAILDFSGRVVVQKGKTIGVVPAKTRSNAFCMALADTPVSTTVITREALPERLRPIIDVCVEVYQEEMDNNFPVIPTDLPEYRQQQMRCMRMGASL